MKKPNEGNSGVRNIVHRGEAECTIFRTPLLPELGFFMHHDQERCVYSLHHVISLILSHLKMFFRSISKTFQYNTYLLTKQITVDHNDIQMNGNGSPDFLAYEDNAYTIMT